MFLDHRQEQWPEWLGTAEFVYNNKKHTATQILPFEASYGLSLRIGFEGRRGKRFKVAEEFVQRMRQVQEEVKVVEHSRTYLNKQAKSCQQAQP